MSNINNNFISNDSNLFELLFQHAPNMIFILDKNFVLQHVNQCFVQEVTCQENSLLQQKLQTMISEKSYQLLLPKLQKLLIDKKSFSHDIEFFHHKQEKQQALSFNFAIIQANNSNDFNILCTENSKQQIQQLENKVHHLEFADTITTLGNRHLYLSKLKEFLQQTKIGKMKGFCLVGIDFDNLQKIDDIYGYHIGDKVLKIASERLLVFCHSDDVVFRISGSRLGILHPVDDIDDVQAWADRLMTKIIQSYHINDEQIDIQVSLGIVCVPQDTIDFLETVRLAELALNKAGEDKINSSLVIYDEKLNEEFLRKLHLEEQLRYALANNHIETFYQPQFTLPSRKLQGFEALARWRDPEYGLISPAEFIPIAEETGLIIGVGNQVLRQACEQSVIWDKKGFQHTISINISIVQIKNERFYDDVVNIIHETGANPHNIEFEITESVVISNMQERVKLLYQLKELGISIALDDFGTGYSSLSYIKQIPVDILKIDREFIKNIPHNTTDCAITRTILILAKELLVKVVAEGMEKEEQVLFLEDEDCDIVQGFYFSHPLDVDEANTFIDDYLKKTLSEKTRE